MQQDEPSIAHCLKNIAQDGPNSTGGSYLEHPLLDQLGSSLNVHGNQLGILGGDGTLDGAGLGWALGTAFGNPPLPPLPGELRCPPRMDHTLNNRALDGAI